MEVSDEVKNMTDKELDIAIAEKYGENWNPKEVDDTDELVKEWFYRLVTDVID